MKNTVYLFCSRNHVTSEKIDIYADAYAQIEMIQKEQGWSDESANFLKRLVSNNDPVITGALECFKFTKDESDIAETFGLIIQMGLLK